MPDGSRESIKRAAVTRRDGRLPDAQRDFAEAVALCRVEGSPLRLAHTIRHLGDVHREAGRADLAEPCYREALEIYRRHPEAPPLDLANALRPFALLEEARGGNDPARAMWEEARGLYAAVGVAAGVKECEEHLAKLGGNP
ncbi:MAG: tetratricopeptide repeat protein [Acidobacteria bacterium]|nr:tetratricopeptide repeat protein [Acidobacteriota bacterium]